MASLIWIGFLILFLLIEVGSAQLIAIWFAAAALVTFAISFIITNTVAQAGIFLVLSAVFLALFYPLFKRLYRPKADTNSEKIIGSQVRVVERIEPQLGKGQVKADGKDWTVKVRDLNSEPIEVDKLVRIIAIEGVKLVVEPVKED